MKEVVTYKIKRELRNVELQRTAFNLFHHYKRIAYLDAVEYLYSTNVHSFSSECRIMNTSDCWPDVPKGEDSDWEKYVDCAKKGVSLIEWIFKFEKEK